MGESQSEPLAKPDLQQMPRSDNVHVALEQTSSVLNYLRTKLGVTSEVSVISEMRARFPGDLPSGLLPLSSLAAGFFGGTTFVGGLAVVRWRRAVPPPRM